MVRIVVRNPLSNLFYISMKRSCCRNRNSGHSGFMDIGATSQSNSDTCHRTSGDALGCSGSNPAAAFSPNRSSGQNFRNTTPDLRIAAVGGETSQRPLCPRRRSSSSGRFRSEAAAQMAASWKPRMTAVGRSETDCIRLSHNRPSLCTAQQNITYSDWQFFLQPKPTPLSLSPKSGGLLQPRGSR